MKLAKVKAGKNISKNPRKVTSQKKPPVPRFSHKNKKEEKPNPMNEIEAEIEQYKKRLNQKDK